MVRNLIMRVWDNKEDADTLAVGFELLKAIIFVVLSIVGLYSMLTNGVIPKIFGVGSFVMFLPMMLYSEAIIFVHVVIPYWAEKSSLWSEVYSKLFRY